MNLRRIAGLLRLAPRVVVRVAPSPTGPLHVGTARTALFNYLFARGRGGRFILRIEDTDRARSEKEHEEDILAGLAWLGVAHDSFARQSDRLDRYEFHLRALCAKGAAYVSSAEAGEGRAEVIRLRNPGKTISFEDLVRGSIALDSAELGDFVIAKSFREPLYHLAAVVDDWEMGVTHVIRGEDHISNTPRQILIQEALGAPRPVYAHIPLILAKDRSKLSKRSGTAVALSAYRADGYLPEALVNYLALLGWNPGTDREFFTLRELADRFDIRGVQRGGAVFDLDKLRWFNREYLRRRPDVLFLDDLASYVPERVRKLPGFSPKVLGSLVPLVRERISVYGDFRDLAAAGEFDYFFAAPDVPASLLVPGGEGSDAARKHLAAVAKLLALLPAESFGAERVKKAIFPYATEAGRGAVLWPFRVALSGRERSPDPFLIAGVLGKEETLRRISAASATLGE